MNLVHSAQVFRAAAYRWIGAAGRRPILARALRPAFERLPGICWGVFDTFREAEASAPGSRPIGYDHDEAATLYRELHGQVEPKDYAVAFWLQRHLKPGHRVFDFGGNDGIKYYALQTVMEFPQGVSWTVCDVPAVAAAGRRLAAERGATGLVFTESLADASGAQFFLALGSLQYVETPLPELLAPLKVLPSHVVVSSTPMVEGRRYVTLQNLGPSYCPYLIEDRGALVRGMGALGYTLVRSWRNAEKRCRILGRPDRSVRGYSSMHFALEAPV